MLNLALLSTSSPEILVTNPLANACVDNNLVALVEFNRRTPVPTVPSCFSPSATLIVLELSATVAPPSIVGDSSKSLSL